jgi:TP901 family phage tail tape measure protein
VSIIAGKIKGITITLGADVQPLNKALQDVNKKSKGLQSELRQVERLLKLDPSNTTLLAQKQRILAEAVANSREKLDRLRTAQSQVEEQFRRGEIGEEQYRAFQRELIRAEQELNRFEDDLRRSNDRLRQFGEGMQDTGKKMAAAGKNLSMKVTAPIVGMGAAIVKTGMDFEEAMSRVAAISGATGGELEKLEQQAKNLGATTKFSASEAASAQEFLAMAGFKVNDILSAMPGLLDLAAAGALDLGNAADITSNIMSGFGIEASKTGHIADVLAKASSSANTNVAQLGAAMKPLAPVANTLGWSMEEATAAVMALSDAGIQGEQAGTAFATSLGRLAKPTGEMAKVINELGISFFDASGNMKSMPDVISEVENATEGMTAQQKSATLTTLFGAEAYKQWAILLDRGSEALGETTEGLVSADGAAAQMAKTMSENTKGGIKELLSALEGLAIQLSETLLPIISSAVNKLTEWTRKFAELSPASQKVILVIAGLAAALGPLLLIFGPLVTAVGGLITAIGAMGAAMAAGVTGVGVLTAAFPALAGVVSAAGAAFTVLTGPVGLAVAAIAGIVVGGKALVNHLSQDAIPEIDRFGDSVSEATQEAVGGFLDLNDQATVALNQLAWSGQEVTAEMADSLINAYSQMNQQILSGLDERHKEELANIQQFFDESEALTDQEEAEILANMEEGHTKRQEAIKEGEARIKEILNTASEEKRALTKQEQEEINRIQQDMKETGIRVLSENEVEAKVILERMKQNASTLTAQQAAEVIRNSIEQRDKAIEAAEQQHDEVVASIIRQRDELGVISEEQAQKLIAEATRQKDESVAKAEEMHLRVVQEAQGQAEEHINWVDWETGEVLSKWEVFKGNVARKWNDMLSGTRTAWENIKKSVIDKANNLKIEAISKLNELWDHIKSIPAQALQWGRDIIQGLINGIKSLRIPLPHFNFSVDYRSVAGVKFPVPDVDVRWYKTGGIFTSPTIAGIGDVPEAVLPLDKLTPMLTKSLSEAIRSVTPNNNIGGVTVTGNTFYVRNDNDIKLVARELYNLQQTNARGRGLK